MTTCSSLTNAYIEKFHIHCKQCAIRLAYIKLTRDDGMCDREHDWLKLALCINAYVISGLCAF